MKVAVIGGDKRMLFAAKAFSADGYEVSIAGFDRLVSLCDIRIADAETVCEWADIIVLPVRPVADGHIAMPFSDIRITVPELMSMIGEKPVFSGCASLLKPYAQGEVYDYAVREDFTVKNAELTAEGAVGILLNDYEGAVFGTDILVTGYGRIGKILSAYLRRMGAHVTAAARKDSDRAMIGINGMTALDYPDIDWGRYPVIINTVPFMVLDAPAVDAMDDDVYIIDLASAPGGVDFDKAQGRGLSCMHALSLPGKTAPLAAGRIIRDTVIKIMSGR